VRILITGDRGYIGSNLSNYFLDKGYDIYGVDKNNGKYVEHISSVDGFDYIIHLAAMSGVEDCRGNSDSAIINNVLATLHLFKIAHNKVPIIFASSGAAQSPREHMYAMTKRVGELEAERLNRSSEFNLNIKVLRFSNVYGGVDYVEKKKSIISNFTKGPILINGDGSQTRDFIHVTDICRAIDLAMKSRKIFNIPLDIGTGINTSILDLAKMFEKEYHFSPDSDVLVGLHESPSEVESAEVYLGFKASIDLKDYIRGLTEASSPSVNTNSLTSNPSES
jgi:UDP-glucose 4-epimerase